MAYTNRMNSSVFAAAALLTLICVSACGSHKPKQTVNITHAQTTVAPTVTAGTNASGDPAEGLGGSLDPHPSACSTCSRNGLNTVDSNAITNPHQLTCTDSTAGIAVTCEGMCFVDPSITPIWANEPPSSGPVYPTLSYGFGLQEDVVERGYWVHNLAHGFVVLTYNCPSGCDSDVNALKQIYNDLAGSTLIITADPDLKGSKFAALAWGYQMTFDAVDPAAVECFVMQHLGHGYPHGQYVPPAQ